MAKKKKNEERMAPAQEPEPEPKDEGRADAVGEGEPIPDADIWQEPETDEGQAEPKAGELVPVLTGEVVEFEPVEEPDNEVFRAQLAKDIAEAVTPIQVDPDNVDAAAPAIKDYLGKARNTAGLALASWRKAAMQAGMSVAYAREAGFALLAVQKEKGREFTSWYKANDLDHNWVYRAKNYATYLPPEACKLVTVHKADELVRQKRAEALEAPPATTPMPDVGTGTPQEAPPALRIAPETKPAKAPGTAPKAAGTPGKAVVKQGPGRPPKESAKPDPDKEFGALVEKVEERIEAGGVSEKAVLDAASVIVNFLGKTDTLASVDWSKWHIWLEMPLDRFLEAVRSFERHVHPTWLLESAARLVEDAHTVVYNAGPERREDVRWCQAVHDLSEAVDNATKELVKD